MSLVWALILALAVQAEETLPAGDALPRDDVPQVVESPVLAPSEPSESELAPTETAAAESAPKAEETIAPEAEIHEAPIQAANEDSAIADAKDEDDDAVTVAPPPDEPVAAKPDPAATVAGEPESFPESSAPLGPTSEEGYGAVGLKNDGAILEVESAEKRNQAPTAIDPSRRNTSSLPEESALPENAL